MPQIVVEIPLSKDLAAAMNDQLKLGRKIKTVLPRYAQGENKELQLVGYMAIVKAPKTKKLPKVKFGVH